MCDVKVSIIIPTYNTEKYLCQCLDTVVNQTLKDIEIICVDNSSTDNTLNILNEYAEKDNRINVISKVNEGPGVSRNVGIEVACGEYVGFVDSDDYIELDMFEKLYDVAKSKDLDLCMCKITTFEDGTNNFDDNGWYFASNCLNDMEEVFNYHDVMEYIEEFSATAYNKIYKKSVILENNIRFPCDVFFEDEVFFYDVFLHSNRIYFLKESLYFYRMNRSGSLMGSPYFPDFIKIIMLVRNIFIETNNYEDYKSILCNALLSKGFWLYSLSSKEFHESFFNDLKEYCSPIFEDEEILKNLSDEIVDRVDNLINSSNWMEFDEKEIFKDISVILLCYNNENTIENCIQSVFNQNLDFEKHIQLLIIDDGSEDETRRICEKYVELFPKNVLYVYQEHQGKSKAIHTAAKYSKGKYFYYFDGDGEIKKDIFSEMFDF